MADGRMPNSGMRARRTNVFKSKNRKQRRRERKQEGRGQGQQSPNQPIPGANDVPQSNPQGNFPGPQEAPPNFMPYMPEYEAGLRGIEDQYAAQRQGIQNQMNQIAPTYGLQMARMNTDRGNQQGALDQGMSERGLLDSGVRSQLSQRDIQLPFGRSKQDLATWATGQYGDLQSQLGANDLAYNQQMAELLLNNAAAAAAAMPSNVPQYSQGQKPRRRRGKNNG